MKATRHEMPWLLLGVGAGVLSAWYLKVLRPWHMRWGATDDDLARALPGDECVPDPHVVMNHAVEIDVPPKQVWPWLVQIGEGRAGFYSYAWIENVQGMHISNADEILPEYQELHPGDVIPAGPDGIPVLDTQPGRYLVLGAPDNDDLWFKVTWSMNLIPVEEGRRTKLHSRVRSRVTRWTPAAFIWSALMDPGVFIMNRKMLLGIKERAEAHADKAFAAD